ncbi:hypothetical protein [Streptomyces sp. NPDC056227]|uniref:hypothetical protein n=1 Tax=Streptomyces sp. NPDC056227 TaxID=3345753 RepID=UPI0035E00793
MWSSRAAARTAIFEYVEGWYNVRHLHSRIVSGRTSNSRCRSLSVDKWWSRPANTARSVPVSFGSPTWRCNTSS